MTKVSVVIPLYNKEPYIKRALSSVLEQTEQDFEIIVVDDGSTDRGAEVVREFKDDRIRLVQQPNAGVAAARNKGIEAATAEAVAFLDADDVWKARFLEIVLGLHRKFPQAGMCCAAYEYRDKDNRTRIPRILGIPKGVWEGIVPDFFAAMLGAFPAHSSAVLIPKKTFLDSGFFPVGEKLNEDLDLWVRIALKHSVAFSSAVGAVYFRDIPQSICSGGEVYPERQVKKTCLKALQEGAVKGVSAEHVKEFVCAIDLEVATRMLLVGRKSEAKKLIARCETQRFLNKKRLLFFSLFLPRALAVLFYQLKQRVLPMGT